MPLKAIANTNQYFFPYYDLKVPQCMQQAHVLLGGQTVNFAYDCPTKKGKMILVRQRGDQSLHAMHLWPS